MDGVYEEIRINEDGTKVDVAVRGIKGPGCAKLQKKYEEHMQLLNAQKTGEYFEGGGSSVVEQSISRG